MNDVSLIIHVTGNALRHWYPQLMFTSLPLQTVVFSGDVVIVTIKDMHRSYFLQFHTKCMGSLHKCEHFIGGLYDFECVNTHVHMQHSELLELVQLLSSPRSFLLNSIHLYIDIIIFYFFIALSKEYSICCHMYAYELFLIATQEIISYSIKFVPFISCGMNHSTTIIWSASN